MVGESPKAGRLARCSRRHPRHAEKHDLLYAHDDGRGEVLFQVFELAFEVFGLDTWTLKLTHLDLKPPLNVPGISSDIRS